MKGMKKIIILVLCILSLFLVSFVFTSCEEVTSSTNNISLESKITFKTLKVDGLNVTSLQSFSNATTEFSFADEIETIGNASYEVASDKYGSQTYLMKVVPLNEGNNTFYVFENVDGKINVYEITLRRRPMYTVSFNENGGSMIQDQTVEEGSFATIPQTTYRLGYDFARWDYDFTQAIMDDIFINAEWEVVEEMQNFNFISTATACSIAEIKDKTVKEIIVPDYVTSISEGAFSGCSSLESIVLPFVGDEGESSNQYPLGYIFGCLSYTGSTKTCQEYYYSKEGYSATAYYYIPTSLKKVKITGNKILCKEFYNCDNLTSVEIGNSVTSIGSYAFYNCSNLTNVEIGNSVTSIDSSAFYNCIRLASVVIPDNVTSIGSYAFYNCECLTSVEIGNSVKSIGSSAFRGCSSLTFVYITDIEAWCNIKFGDFRANPFCCAEYLYWNNESIKELEIPNTVTSISEYAFCGCNRLTSVVIPNGVMSIGEYAFSGCSWLTSVVISDSVTSIGEHAFYDCYGLTEIVIPDNVTSIGEYAFNECIRLTIYCEAESKPSGWNSNWNISNRPVVWGYTGEE